MLPVRCFTCNKVIGQMWEPYTRHRRDASSKTALDALGLRRVCCRRMILTHASVIDDLVVFSNADRVLDDCDTRLDAEVHTTRTVPCE